MSISLINGEWKDSIPAADRGLAYGDGVFETMKMVSGKIPFWHQHMNRLRKGLDRLSIPSSNIESACRDDVRLLLQSAPSNQNTAVIKLIVTRGNKGKGYLPEKHQVPTRICSLLDDPYASCHTATGLRIKILNYRLSAQPYLAGIKHLNRLDQVLASMELSVEDDEGILRDAQGYLVEGTKTNLCWQKGDRWFTPDLSNVGIKGVMLSMFKRWMALSGMPVETVFADVNSLCDADNIVMMNSIMGVHHVLGFNDRDWMPALSVEGLVARFNEWLYENFGYFSNFD